MKTPITATELKLLTLYAAGRSHQHVAANCGLSMDAMCMTTYSLRKKLGMGPLASVREWARDNLNTLTVVS
jgi:hypothetical protein